MAFRHKSATRHSASHQSKEKRKSEKRSKKDKSSKKKEKKRRKRSSSSESDSGRDEKKTQKALLDRPDTVDQVGKEDSGNIWATKAEKEKTDVDEEKTVYVSMKLNKTQLQKFSRVIFVCFSEEEIDNYFLDMLS